MKRKLALLGACLLLVASCSSAPQQKVSVTPAPEAPEPGNLPAQTLEPSECGLFLWTQGTPRRFIFFSRAASGQAIAMLEVGKQEQLTLAAQRGDLFGQFMTEMDYAMSGDGAVFLHLTPGESVEGGQKISSGRIELLDAGGWSTIIPVVGVRACQPDPE